MSAKRRKESNNCARRLEAARDRLIRSQEHLRSLLKEKDDRKKVLIDTIAKQKVGRKFKFKTDKFLIRRHY